MKKQIMLTGENLTIEEVVSVARDRATVKVPEVVIKRIQDNWNAIAEMLNRGDVIYGLNTGIGGFGNVKISKAVADLSGNLQTRSLDKSCNYRRSGVLQGYRGFGAYYPNISSPQRG